MTMEQKTNIKPTAWLVDVDLNNYQGQSEFRKILSFRPDPVTTDNYEITQVIDAQPLYLKPELSIDISKELEQIKRLSISGSHTERQALNEIADLVCTALAKHVGVK